MLLNKDGNTIENNSIQITDTKDLTLHDDQILPLQYWLDNKLGIKSNSNRIAIWLNSDDDLDSLSEDISSIALIALNFPKFADGRAFSMAHLLRSKYGFKGHLRAIGKPIADQAQFIFRCGFDSVDVPEGDNIDIWSTEAKRMSLFYQRSVVNNQTQNLY